MTTFFTEYDEKHVAVGSREVSQKSISETGTQTEANLEHVPLEIMRKEN